MSEILTYYRGEENLNPKIEEAFKWYDEKIGAHFIATGVKADPFVILAGGALRSFFMNQAVRDYDLYFRSQERLIDAQNRFQYHPWLKIATPSKTSMVFQKSALDPKGGLDFKTVNIITNKYYEHPRDVIDTYDFTVCMCALNSEEISFHPDYFTDLATKQLRIHKLDEPLQTMWRILKYERYGFEISKEELWRVIEAVHSMPTIPNIAVTPEEKLTNPVSVDSIFSGS